jgi:hypothetical protein
VKVFLPIATEQDLVVRARANVATVDLVLRKEREDESTTYADINTSYSNGWLTIPFTHTFAEGDSYEIEVLNSATDAVLWRGKCFVTAQTPQEYKMHT